MHLDFVEDINFVQVFNCENLLACLKLLQSRKLAVSTERLELQTCGSSNLESDSSDIILKLAPLKVSKN